VVQVLFEDRIMPWNYSAATSTSKWVNVYGINRFYPDFDPLHPAELTVVFRGTVNEPCPAQAQFDAPGESFSTVH
jgi:hypothetical protein